VLAAAMNDVRLAGAKMSCRMRFVTAVVLPSIFSFLKRMSAVNNEFEE